MGPRAKAIANPMASPRRNRSNDTRGSEHADAPAIAGACRSPRGARRAPAHHTSRGGRFCSAMRAGSAVRGRRPQSESMAAECAVRAAGLSIGRQAGPEDEPLVAAERDAVPQLARPRARRPSPPRRSRHPAAPPRPGSGVRLSSTRTRSSPWVRSKATRPSGWPAAGAIGVQAPRWSAGDARRSASSRRWRWSIEAGSARCASTLHDPASSTIGSHGSADREPGVRRRRSSTASGSAPDRDPRRRRSAPAARSRPAGPARRRSRASACRGA